MKIILLAAYLISFSFQQDATSAKKTDKTPTTQEQKTEVQNTGLNATHKEPVKKEKEQHNNAADSPLNKSGKSETPKN